MMNEDAQVLSVTIEGFRFVFDVTKENIELMQKALMLFYRVAEKTEEKGKNAVKKIISIPKHLIYRKKSGKTNIKNFNSKAGAGTMFTLDEKYMKQFKKLAKKNGVIFVTAAKYNRDSKKAHILIPAKQSGMVNIIMQLILEKEIAVMKKNIKKEVRSEGFRGKELKEEVKKRIETNQKELEADNQIESFEQFAVEQQFDEISPTEMKENLEKNDFQFPPVRAEDIKVNVEEIKNAIDKKLYGGIVNDHSMIYAEFNLDRVTGQNEKNVTITDNALENEITVPKECLVNLNNGKCIIVMPKETTATVKNIKTEEITQMEAVEFKKMMEKENGYSKQFSQLFYESGNKKSRKGTSL